MEVTHHPLLRPEDLVGRPRMPMEDSYAVPSDSGGGMDNDLPRKVASESPIVVAQDDFGGVAFF
jgi:hypothetical protein